MLLAYEYTNHHAFQGAHRLRRLGADQQKP